MPVESPNQAASRFSSMSDEQLKVALAKADFQFQLAQRLGDEAAGDRHEITREVSDRLRQHHRQHPLASLDIPIRVEFRMV